MAMCDVAMIGFFSQLKREENNKKLTKEEYVKNGVIDFSKLPNNMSVVEGVKEICGSDLNKLLGFDEKARQKAVNEWEKLF